MSTISDFVTSTQDQVLASLKQGEDVIVQGLRDATETLEGLVPFVSQLPSPADTVASAFSFTNSVLASQRDMVASILKSIEGTDA